MNIGKYKFYSLISVVTCVLLLWANDASAQRRRGSSRQVSPYATREVVKVNSKDEYFKQQAKVLQRELKETQKRLKETEKDLVKTQRDLDKCSVKSPEWRSRNPYYAEAPARRGSVSNYEEDDYYVEPVRNTRGSSARPRSSSSSNVGLDAQTQKDLIEIEALKQTLAEKQENQKRQMEQLNELKNAIQGLKDSQFVEYDNVNVY